MRKLSEIQELYNTLCRKYSLLSVKAYFVSGEELDYRGLYIEWPFRKIYLNTDHFNDRTIYHEFFHHLNPSFIDGVEFERLLDEFINKELSEKI
jgi:hypothetical protein